MSSEVNFGATVTTPTGFDPEKESLPMIVFLHGAGERGEDLSIVNKVGLPKYFTADPDYKGLRVITLSPQCPDYTVWNDVSLQLFQFILKAAKAYNADMDRISVTGLSMGGFGTWEMVISHPDFFSAAAPICGGGSDMRRRHGLEDTVIPADSDPGISRRRRPGSTGRLFEDPLQGGQRQGRERCAYRVSRL